MGEASSTPFSQGAGSFTLVLRVWYRETKWFWSCRVFIAGRPLDIGVFNVSHSSEI